MDGVASIARWLRETLAAQPWLAPIQPFLAQMPDWALLVAPAFIVPLLMWSLFRLRRNAQKKPKASRSRKALTAPAKSPARLARATLAPVPSQPPIAPPTEKSTSTLVAHRGAPMDDDDNRSVRVFVSSTFLDMQDERNILVKEIFPALRARMRARGVELFEVDLRWGITKEQQERGETLPTLLAEIDRCRPYFIGLIGDRYGWVPPAEALTAELKAAYPSIANADGVSVTAMEIMHGVLTDPDAAARAFFFERDPRWDWASTLNEQDRVAPDANRAKLADLKTAIRTKGMSVQPYGAPAAIGPALFDALAAAMEARFPEAKAPDAFEQTARLHRAYARERRGLHIGAASYRSDLDQWMGAADAPPILITGASGGGKSTLIANWLHAWRGSHPNDIVFEHYLGASPDSADPSLVMRRLWEQLNRDTGEHTALPGGDAELMDLSGRLAERVARASSLAESRGGKILVALDGLDKLYGEKGMRWLPDWPNVKLVSA